MKVVTRGKFVCCPKCGTRATVTEVGMDRFICKNKDCNARFGGWVVDGFVVTYEEKITKTKTFSASLKHVEASFRY